MRRRGHPPSNKAVRLWGRHAVHAALDNPLRHPRRLWATREAAAKANPPSGLTVTFADVADLGRMVPADAPHQGLVLEVDPLEGVFLDDLITATGGGGASEGPALILLLDSITDPHNVGAILRSAAAFDAVGIVTQDRHSPPESGVIARSASGALETVPWARVVNLSRALDELGEAGFWRIGLAGEAKIDIASALGPQRIALVLGAEGEGLRQNVAAHCDTLARLPISGRIESLNVSNAAAIALYAARQHGRAD